MLQVTTRAPRPDERHGTDYTFLSRDEFVELEKTGELLESGIYDGECRAAGIVEYRVKLIIGSNVRCLFCFAICTPEQRGGEKGGNANFET